MQQALAPMRRLTAAELTQVSGGITIADATSVGTGAGGVGGILLTNTLRGAAMGGALGAALGFSFGVGWAIGSSAYRYAAVAMY